MTTSPIPRLATAAGPGIGIGSAMPTQTFHASRWTSGNRLFPTVIEVTDKAVVRRKRSWFSSDEMSVSLFKVASVHIRTGIFWADIRIASTGGSDDIASRGHRKADAREIKRLVEDWQSQHGGTPQS